MHDDINAVANAIADLNMCDVCRGRERSHGVPHRHCKPDWCERAAGNMGRITKMYLPPIGGESEDEMSNIKWIAEDAQLQVLALTGTTTTARIAEYNAIDLHDIVQGINPADMMQAIAWDCVDDHKRTCNDRLNTLWATIGKCDRVIDDAEKAEACGLLDNETAAAAEKARRTRKKTYEEIDTRNEQVINCNMYMDNYSRPEFTATTSQEGFFVALLSYVLTGRGNKALLKALTIVVSAATDYRVAVIRDNQPATRTGFTSERVQATRTAFRASLDNLQAHVNPSGNDTTWLVPRAVAYRAYELDNIADALAPVQAYQRDGVYRLGIVRGKSAAFARTLVRIVIGKRQNQSFTIG